MGSTTKTPRKVIAKSSVTKFAVSKKKYTPNASILSYFKKTADESLFISDGQPSLRVEGTLDGENIYDVDDDDDDNDNVPETRFNEIDTPVKKRRLTPPEEEEEEKKEKEEQPPRRPNTAARQKKSPSATVSKQPKKVANNPFLDDSSDEEDEEERGGGSSRITPPTGTIPGQSESETKSGSGNGSGEKRSVLETPESLLVTPSTTTTTEPPSSHPEQFPLLRQETSNECNGLTGAGDDDSNNTKDDGDGPGNDDDGDDFGGEELFASVVDDVDIDDDFADDDGEPFAGEEYREMRYMEEQARLEEAEESESAANRNDRGDSLAAQALMTDDDSIITECCPICNGSLSGITPDEATAHVNACLDGNPTPLPASLSVNTKPGDQVEGSSLGKRFARAAVPRPGQVNPIDLGGPTGGGGGGGGGKGEKGGQSVTNSAFAKLMSGHAEDAAWQTAAAAEHASRGKPAYQRTCPFYKIMPGFSICVDAFRYGAVAGCRAYFLSHFHSDHYVGLTASWTHGPIYCSRVTGSLVKSQLRTAARFVVELDFETRVPVPDTDGVFVTMIPANHCPGSSLFLFEKTVGGSSSSNSNITSRTQRILHCGDFRACPAHVTHPQLRPHAVLEAMDDAVSGGRKTMTTTTTMPRQHQQQKIDVCYLDTTYLNPRYSFPPQEDVIRACAELCVALDRRLADGDDTAWDALLRRREGGPPAGLDGVTRFFSAAASSDKNKDKGTNGNGTNKTTSKTPPNDPNTPTPPPNALTALGKKNNRNNRLLVVCGTYSIGKERICKAIAQALGTRIFATPAKTRLVRQLGDPELSALMTSDPRAGQVHMQALAEIRADTLAAYLAENREHGFARVVGFRPSGWNYRPTPGATSQGNSNGGGGKNGNGNGNGNGGAVSANMHPSSLPTAHLLHSAGWKTRFGARDLVPLRGSTREAVCLGVPYSEHSSFRELALFLLALRIERVVPTVNVGSEASRARMKGWIDRWLGERRKGGLITVLEEEKGSEEDGEGLGDVEMEKREKSGGKVGRRKKEGGMALWEGKDGKGGGVYW